MAETAAAGPWSRAAAVRWVAPVLALLALWGWSELADHRERIVRLRVACGPDTCSATLGGESVTVPVAPDPHGRRVGLYAYTSFEVEAAQAFRHVAYRAPLSPDPARAIDFRSDRDLDRLELDAGWSIAAGGGLVHHGVGGDRGVALLRDADARVFELDVELDDPTDAGVIVQASRADSGLLFVVRGRYNDAFFCRLDDGRTGPILGIMPVAELRWPRELLRLSGLCSRITLGCLAFLALLRLALRLAARRAGGRTPAPPSLASLEHPALVPALFVTTFLALGAVALFGFGGVPHVPDEIAYVFQAKVFAQGALWATEPELPEFFWQEHLIHSDGRWFGKYPPLFPLLLALGWLFRAPWCVNALLGAGTAAAVFVLARDLVGRRWALLAWPLAQTSPFFVILGGSLMAHMAAAFFLALFLLFLLRALDRESARCAVLAGFALGLAFLTRPYTALLVGAAGAVHVLLRLVAASGRMKTIEIALVLAAATTPGVLAYAGWTGIHSSASEGLSFNAYTAYNDTDRLGFGEDRGRGWLRTWGSWGHTPAKALHSVHQYLDYTSHYLWGWPLRLSFAFVIAAWAWGRRRSELRLLGSVLVFLVVGHMFYWATQHVLFGARYWFCALPALIVLSVVGLEALVRVEAPASGRGRVAAVRLVLAVLAALVAFDLVAYLPARFHELPVFGGITADLPRVVARERLEAAVVFIPTEGPMYNDGFFLNDPWLRRGPIFARDLGADNAKLLALYPHYRAYRWTGTTLEDWPQQTPAALSAARSVR